MFAGGCVGPFARPAASVVRAGKPDIETAARRVTGITDQPVAALTMTLRQIVTAHRLGLLAETLSKLTCLIRQKATYDPARSHTRWIGQRFIPRSRTATPPASPGTNKRNPQLIIPSHK